MQKEVFQEKKLGELEIRLIKSAGLGNEEIEKVVSNPKLFNSVLLKIEGEKKTREQKLLYKKWFGSPNLNWRISLAFGLFVILIAALSGLFIFRPVNSSQGILAENIDAPKAELPSQMRTALMAQPFTAPDSFKLSNLFAKRKELPHQSTKRIQNKIFVRFVLAKEAPQHRIKSDNDEGFYPLIFAGNLNDTNDDQRIIRVELSKESLASLGMDIPVMNENEKIKSDLLISSDGVPQAVRFVKNSKNDFKKVRRYEKGS